jgi:hypothetical protein
METTFSPSFATHNCPRSVHKVHVWRLLFPHRELHTIVLDQYTKSLYRDYCFPIVSYIPLSSISTQSPCTETTFRNRALHTILYSHSSRPVHKFHERRLLSSYLVLHTILLDQYTNSMNGEYFLPILCYIPFF